MNELIRPSLRQIASVGTLYDAKSDQFLQASILRQDLPAGNLPLSGHSFDRIFKTLRIREDTALNILSGLVQPQGATIYLQDFEATAGALRGAIHYEVSAASETLVNESLKEAFEWGSNLDPAQTHDCTHVVTGIRWGLQTIVSLNYSGSGGPDQSKDQVAFERDLKALESIIKSAHLGQPNYPAMELSNDITLYSDVLESEGLVLQTTLDVCDFIRIVPDHISQQSNGRGWPISYTLMPITVLHYFISIPGTVRCDMKAITADYLTGFIHLFDEFDACVGKLRNYHTYLEGQRLHLTADHIDEVSKSLRNLEKLKEDTVNDLRHLLVDVRSGNEDLSSLSHLYHHVASGESSPSQLSAIAGQETQKLEFVRSMVALGAKYIGSNGPALEVIKWSHKDMSFHVFHLDSYAMHQQKEWGDNCILLEELIRQKGHVMPVYILDYDTADCETYSALPRISMFNGGKEILTDVLENRRFMAEQCFARFPDGSLDTSSSPRPVKRRFVKVPCPSQSCNSKNLEWKCPRCLTVIEYGFVDSFFYCECGRCVYNAYEFRCNDPKHKVGFVKYDSDTLHKLLSGLNQADYVNILILGETGVGKSTFINSFINYLSYSTLDEAKSADGLASVIPCSFSLQTMDRENPDKGIQEYNVQVGTRDDEADGSKGDSATQRSAVYPVTIGSKTYRLIDTPGIGDTRGISFDKKNMADILETISSYDELHGILILLKSNNARLTITFRFCVKELLTHLHRSAASNMAFGFTNTRISNYTPGDTFGPLKALLEQHSDVGITLSTSTTYCFDSESFRYLAACKQKVPVPNEEDFRRSWDHSSKEAHRLLRYFASTSPHPVTSTLSLNGTRKLISELTTPMANISSQIRKNMRLCDNKLRELADTKLTGENLLKRLRLERIQFEAKRLSKPRTVCKMTVCCDFKDSGKGDGEVVTIYKSHCHAECYLENVKHDVIADPGLIRCAAFAGQATCIRCGHEWQEHLHVLYELKERKVEVMDSEIARQLRRNVSDVTLRETSIDEVKKVNEEYREELEEIQHAAARFCVFLSENAITAINDATLEYLDMLIKNEKDKVEAGRLNGISVYTNEKHLADLESDKQAHIQLVETLKRNIHNPKSPGDRGLDEQGVNELVQKLYKLKHHGADLKRIKYVIDESIEGTYRERPYRVPTSNSGRRSGNWRSKGSRSESSSSYYYPSSSTQKGRRGYRGWNPAEPPRYAEPVETNAQASRLPHEDRGYVSRITRWMPLPFRR
ncbi:hypothetical protein PT974_12419 [Cladobotryum mycophilum]|uniref:G domain-containing protein n=1 Tax=Cladobotryum mycophilum TaxID=491253 RepID=A0ABR0S8W9_9HYPO